MIYKNADKPQKAYLGTRWLASPEDNTGVSPLLSQAMQELCRASKEGHSYRFLLLWIRGSQAGSLTWQEQQQAGMQPATGPFLQRLTPAQRL